jgi:hypothetical protein
MASLTGRLLRPAGRRAAGGASLAAAAARANAAATLSRCAALADSPTAFPAASVPDGDTTGASGNGGLPG